LLLILALRTGSVGATSFDGLVTITLAGRDTGIVQWTQPDWPLIPAFPQSTRTTLDMSKAANTGQLASTLEEVNKLLGVHDKRLWLHDIRRGVAKDATAVKTANSRGLGLAAAQDQLGHTNASAYKGVTAKYAGASVESTWEDRANLDQDVWTLNSAMPLNGKERKTLRAHRHPRVAYVPPSENTSMLDETATKSADPPAAKRLKTNSATNGVSVDTLEESCFPAPAAAPEIGSFSIAEQESFDVYMKYPWLGDLLDSPSYSNVDVQASILVNNDVNHGSPFQDLANHEFNIWATPESFSSRSTEQDAFDIYTAYPWLGDLLESPSESNIDVEANILASHDVNHGSPLQDPANGDSIPQVAAARDAAVAKLVFSPPDFIKFFSKVNVTNVQVEAKSQAHKLDGMHGNSRDAPTLFVYMCQKTAGCEFETTSKTVVERHEVSCSPEHSHQTLEAQVVLDAKGEWKCDTCGAKGRSKDPRSSLSEHKRKKHTWKPKRCTVADCDDDTEFADIASWTKHSQQHTGNLPCSVNGCSAKSKTYKDSSSLRRHIILQHNVAKGPQLEELIKQARQLKKARELEKGSEA
jgi:hypothetical protein